MVLVEPGAADTRLWDEARRDLTDRRGRSVRPEAYDRATAALDVIRERAADPAEVAAVVGEALHAAHPRFRYRAPAGRGAVRPGRPAGAHERPRQGRPQVSGL